MIEEIPVVRHVRLKGGKTKMAVLEEYGSRLLLAYYNLDGTIDFEGSRYRDRSDTVLWDVNDPQCQVDREKKVEKMKNDLYQTKEEKPRFGTLLGKTNQGKLVLEIKGGNGAVETFEPDELEKVVPWTFRATTRDSKSGQAAYFSTKKDSVKWGDILVSDKGVLYFVAEVNVRAEGVPEFVGSKLKSTPIGVPEEQPIL